MNALIGMSIAIAVAFGPQVDKPKGAKQTSGKPVAAAKIPNYQDVDGTCAEKATARCLYKCKCTYFKRRKVACKRSVLLSCAGRMCSPCLSRAKLKARKKCRVRGPVRKCYCTFKKIRQVP
jgi:hypothetical protein